MGLFDKTPKGTRQTVVQAAGAGSIAVGGDIRGGVVVTGEGNRVAGAGAQFNHFSDGVVSTTTVKGNKAQSHMIVNGLEIVSDGSVKAKIEIEDGELYVNGRWVQVYPEG